MTIREKQADFLVMVSKLVCFMDAIKKAGFVNEWYRTPERQKELVDAGRAWTLNSKHISGLAVDIILLKDGKVCWDVAEYKPLAEYWQKIGGRAGYFWTQVDAVHFEYKEGV